MQPASKWLENGLIIVSRLGACTLHNLNFVNNSPVDASNLIDARVGA